jgi:zinc protease
VIGYEHDLRAMTRDDLYGWYRAAYTPNNAYVVAAGDFDADATLVKIEQAFGAIPAGAPMPPVRAIEPPQIGERRVTLRQPAPTSYLRVGFHTPEGRHPDTAAIMAADAVLSGAKGMGIAGGGPMGRSARLYRALVASGLARAAGSDFDLYLDPYLLMIGVTALPGADTQLIESTVERELQRLIDEPVPDDEFTRALKQVKAQYVYSGEGVTNQAFWLGQMEMMGDYRRADTFVDEIERVTPADVQRVAATYFKPSQRTVAWLHPAETGGGSNDAGVSGIARFWGLGGPSFSHASNLRPFERIDLENGIRLLGQAQPDDPSVTVRFRTRAGSASDPAGKFGLAALTARSLTRGTASRSFEEINEFTDGLGASMSLEPSQLSTDLRIRCLSEDLPALIDLAAEILQAPSFPDEEVAKVRAEMTAAIKEQDDDTRSVADRTMRSLIYASDHPLGHRVLGDAESLAKLAPADLRAFHASLFGTVNLTVSAVGGFPALESLRTQLERAFSGWASQATRPALDLGTNGLSASERAERGISGKSQADIALGLPAVSRLYAGFQPFDMANLVLGRLGLMGRLGANVRDKLGLAYYAVSMVEPGRAGSLWVTRIGVDPGNIDRAIEATETEIERLCDDLIPDDELADAKSYLTGVLPLALESNDGIVNLLLSIDYFDLGLDYLERYPGIVRAVTAEQIREAAQANLQVDRLAIGIAKPA